MYKTHLAQQKGIAIQTRIYTVTIKGTWNLNRNQYVIKDRKTPIRKKTMLENYIWCNAEFHMLSMQSVVDKYVHSYLESPPIEDKCKNYHNICQISTEENLPEKKSMKVQNLPTTMTVERNVFFPQIEN